MASPSPSPDYKRYSPSPKREALPERSRSNSQTRWGKQKENGTGEWESWPSSHWGWQTWYENEEEDWQSWSQKDTDWQWKDQRKWETWQGQGQGHWDTYQDDWRDTYQDDWSDTYQDDWSDKSSSDRASSAWHRGDGWESDDGPTEVVLKEREWKKRPGSQKEKERLKLVQRVQGKAQTKEELQVQRLAAMGGSRFRRLQKRSHLPRKDGTGGPRYPAGPSQPSQPSQPHPNWVESPGWGDGIWLEQQRMNQEAWINKQRILAHWRAQATPWHPPAVGSGWVIYPGQLPLQESVHITCLFHSWLPLLFWQVGHSSQHPKTMAKDCIFA